MTICISIFGRLRHQPSIERTLRMENEELLVKLEAMRLLAFKACCCVPEKRGPDQKQSMATWEEAT
jgi:hypothetical protein